MKATIYSNVLLTIITICLVYHVLRDLDLFPIEAYLKVTNKNSMGTMDVDIAYPINVSVDNWDAGTLPVNVE